jgi:hypothetical protein
MRLQQPDITGSATDLAMAATWARACFVSVLGEEDGEQVYQKARMRTLWGLWKALTPAEA